MLAALSVACQIMDTDHPLDGDLIELVYLPRMVLFFASDDAAMCTANNYRVQAGSIRHCGREVIVRPVIAEIRGLAAFDAGRHLLRCTCHGLIDAGIILSANRQRWGCSGSCHVLDTHPCLSELRQGSSAGGASNMTPQTISEIPQNQ